MSPIVQPVVTNVLGTTVVTGNATTGEVLTGTGTKTAHWAAASGGAVGSFASGYWYGSRITNSSSVVLTKGKMYFVPLVLTAAFTVKAIGFVLSTAVATTTIRLGLYTDSGHFQPKAKVLDLGTVVGTTPDSLTIAATHALTAAVYWLCCARQGTSATGTLKARQLYLTWAHAQMNGVAALTTTTTASLAGWVTTGTTHTGGFPTTAPTVTALGHPGTAPALLAKSA